MLKVKDLIASKELDTKAMRTVVGGTRKGKPSLSLDFGTRLDNRVADVSQLFEFGFGQSNAGQVTNNQAIKGGNGIAYAPVDQHLSQDNYLDVFDVGNTYVG